MHCKSNDDLEIYRDNLRFISGIDAFFLPTVSLILSSSTIDKMFEIFGPIFEQNANINFEPIFEKSVNFGPIFEKNANFGRIFEKSVNFEHFVNGK